MSIVGRIAKSRVTCLWLQSTGEADRANLKPYSDLRLTPPTGCEGSLLSTWKRAVR